VGFACALRVCAVRIARALRLEVMVGTLVGVWDGVGGERRYRVVLRRVDGQDERFSQMSVGGGAGGVADGGGEAVGGDGDGTCGVLVAVLVQQVDQVSAVFVGERQVGDGDGVVVFDEEQSAGSGGGGGPPAAHLERMNPGVLRLEPEA
jgi:hypothetical protein